VPTCGAGTSIEAEAFQIRPELKADVGFPEMSRAQDEATQAPERVYVPNRRSCLSRIQGIRGPPLGAAHPARYPTVSRFILEDWARRAMRADLPSRDEHRGGEFSNSAPTHQR
jgi:hypothetical protein